MEVRFYLGLLAAALFFSTSSCEKKVIEGKVAEVTETEVTSNEGAKPEKSPQRELELQQRQYPLVAVEYLMWTGVGSEQLGYSKNTPDPLLEWEGRWIVWEPNGNLLLGREAASPHIWDDQISIGRDGRCLSFKVQRPEGISDLGSYSLLDVTTGEKIDVYDTASVTSQDPDRPIPPQVERIIDGRMERGVDWVSFRLSDALEHSSIRLGAEYELEDGSEKSFQSETLSLRPGGVAVNWMEKPKVLVFRDSLDFQPVMDILVTPAKKNHPVMVDLDSGALHPGGGYGLSRYTQVRFHKTQSDAYVLLSEFKKSQSLVLVLANAYAHQISAEEFEHFTPQQALAHINAVKHEGGSYQIGGQSEGESSHWVALTRQNGVALVRVVPTNEPTRSMHLQLRVIGEL